MIQEETLYKVNINKPFDEHALHNGLYLVVIHATRIPPHIGLILNKKYHSLTIKGHDVNFPVNALIKNSTLRKIPSLFIKIKAHSTFSDHYLCEHFITNVQQFKRVDIDVATCLSPIKLFFEEVYGLSMTNVNYLYELLPLLYKEDIIESISSLNIEEETYQLPIYTNKEINAEIAQIRKEFK